MASSTTLQNSASISERIAARRAAYGGSDRVQPSFHAPQYVQFNSISKSRDLGSVDNLLALISGEIGGASGSQTLYFRVALNGPADLRIRQVDGNPREQQYITTAILGPDHKPLPLDGLGFALGGSDVVGSPEDESQSPLPAGTYWFTVSTSSWQTLPFTVSLQVLRYQELVGSAGGASLTSGRLAMARLRGTAGGSAPMHATVVMDARLRTLAGSIGGQARPQGSLAILRGVIQGAMHLNGRIKATWRLRATAGAAAPLAGLLSVSRGSSGGGGGYG